MKKEIDQIPFSPFARLLFFSFSPAAPIPANRRHFRALKAHGS